MEFKFLCENCGKEIHPKYLTHEEAENINNEVFLLKSNCHYAISPCDCSIEKVEI